MIDTWLQDARFALRLLRRSPLFTLTGALSLAIGIGALSTIFSIASGLLLRPMPGIADPGRVVDIGRTRGGEGFDTTSFPNYVDLRDRNTTLAGMYAYTMEPQAMSLGGKDEAERVYGALVTANYFTVLGTRAEAGRLLQDSDDRGPGANAVAVISHELWERRFARDPQVVGSQISLNGTPFTVLGIAPPGFQGTTLLRPQLWVPMAMIEQAIPRRSAALLTTRFASWIVMGGRLRDGVSLAQANAELDAIGTTLQREHPQANERVNFRAAPSAVFPGRSQPIAMFVGLLLVIVGLLLFVACVNLAGMLLARAAARTREVAVRVALGAGRWRVVRQLLTETLVLFAIGTAGGVLLSTWLTRLLLSLVPQLPVPVAVDMGMDWRVLGLTAGVALVAALLSGLAPALQATRTSLVPALRSDAFAEGRARLRLRNVFVVGQVTISLVLVIAAGLFMRALQHAASVPVGFDQQHVDVVSLDLSLAGYRGVAGEQFLQQLLQRIRQAPGVRAAAATVDLPLDGGRMGLGPITIPGVKNRNGGDSLSADWNVATPGFYATLGIPIRGRDFTDGDTAAAPRVAIVNEAFARAYLPNREAIGSTMTVLDEGNRRVAVTVIGVMADARLMWIGSPAEPYITVPRAQRDMERLSILVKTSGASAIPDVRRIVREMNPNLPVTEAMPLERVTALNLLPQRIAAAAAGALGAVGLLLAAIGVYGVTAYAASRRTREIGIRVALGADPASVMRLLLRQGAVVVAIGVVLGLGLAALGARLVESLLHGVPPLDPVTFGGAALLFAAVTLAATYVPTRRALRVDPMAALRTD